MADYRAAARQFAKRYGLKPGVFVRQIQQESGFNPNARSPAGAQGIAQIMPATAKGWGVNPSDPMASLDAAAKNMARYVKQYGSYRDALVAYNAGPGRVGKALPAETQHYIATILGGSNPSTGGVGGSTGSTTTTTSTTALTPEADQGRRAALANFVLSSGKGDPVGMAQLVSQFNDQTQTTKSSVTTPSSEGSAPSGSSNFRKGHSPLFEEFWQGQGGIDVKNGAKVPQGFVEGHQDHVHVAAGPKTVVELGRIAQQRFGLHVGENPHFGAVHPVHAKNSYHYKGEAIDVSGDPAKMRAFAHYVANLYGIK